MHGITNQRAKSGPKPTKKAKSTVIGLVGTMPVFAINEENKQGNIFSVTGNTNAVKYCGPNYRGYTIPSALEHIYNQTGAQVIVINVFDPQKHKSSVSGIRTFVNKKIELQERGIMNLTLKKDSQVLKPGEDYSFDGSVIQIEEKGEGILADNSEVTVEYDYADPSKVTEADVIGGTDQDGVKSGAQLFYNAKAELQTKPNFIICPGFGSSNTVKNALEIIANKLKAELFIDAPLGTTLSEAIKGRGEAGDINFNTRNTRVNLCFPHFKAYNATEDTYELKPFSPVAVARKVAVINEHNTSWSLSNKPVFGIEGSEIPITFDVQDPECDANLLNDNGILTFVNDRGQWKTWGNRNASYPASSDIDSFECVCCTQDMIEESINNNTIDMIDGPIDDPLIDDIINMNKNFMNDLMNPSDRTILDGTCWFDSEENTVTQLAQGIINVSYDFLPPPPAENIRYKGIVNINYLSKIKGGSN